jgi:hypothetical protein
MKEEQRIHHDNNWNHLHDGFSAFPSSIFVGKGRGAHVLGPEQHARVLQLGPSKTHAAFAPHHPYDPIKCCPTWLLLFRCAQSLRHWACRQTRPE